MSKASSARDLASALGAMAKTTKKETKKNITTKENTLQKSVVQQANEIMDNLGQYVRKESITEEIK